MIEMTAESVITTSRPSYIAVRTECDKCGSLQSCITDDAIAYRCADWHACRVRVEENKHEPVAVRLTDADIVGLLERMETQQADMERLKRIEAAAQTFAKCVAIFERADENHNSILRFHTDLVAAEKALIAVVKGGK